MISITFKFVILAIFSNSTFTFIFNYLFISRLLYDGEKARAFNQTSQLLSIPCLFPSSSESGLRWETLRIGVVSFHREYLDVLDILKIFRYFRCFGCFYAILELFLFCEFICG
ncbi:hypothetical protein EV426DRAFT_625412 [Tirmania nivea]|nr:hypothetical protein EV426DRAFT_625412 [Tirmania nivea]